MSREIKFKAKRLRNNTFFHGYYYRNIDKQHNTKHFLKWFNFKEEIDENTICQLITKIGDVEIYEFDCWYNPYTNKITYLYYSENSGSLKAKIDFNIIINQPYEYLSAFYKQIKKNKLIHIGNWHDGEEFLLSKIKELR